MQELEYKTAGIESSTPCPFHKKAIDGSLIYIGSVRCSECPSFSKIDNTIYTVFCKEDEMLPKNERISWDEYFLKIAEIVALRSTCDRARVGAVIVRDKQILSTGYNGSIVGLPHCDELGHLMIDGHCVRTVHGEMNALTQAALHGVSTKDSTLYITFMPCLSCFKALANAGIKCIVYLNEYKGDGTHSEQIKALLSLAKEAKISIIKAEYSDEGLIIKNMIPD